MRRMQRSSARHLGEGLPDFGIDPEQVLSFLKNDCKIDVGFEAQTLGAGSRSATTTAIIVYTISKLTTLSDDENRAYLEELNKFRSKNGYPDVYGTTHPCSWATMQVALAATEIGAETNFITDIIDAAIRLYQLESGAWCLSGEDDEKLLYAIYPVIVLSRVMLKRHIDYEAALTKTLHYLRSYTPRDETEKIILLGLSSIISRTLYANTKTRDNDRLFYNIDYAKIIDIEFGQYGVNEYTIYPFSMKIYTPALYLLARHFMSPDHPFCLYLIKFLIDNVIEGRAWRHVARDSPRKPCTFCTALSIITLSIARLDFRKRRKSYKSLVDKRVTLKDVASMVMTSTTKIRVFICTLPSTDTPQPLLRNT